MSLPYVSRRRFLYTGAAVTAAALASPRRTLAANSRLKIASIGLGGMGWNDVRALGRQHEIAALCDVDENHLARAASAFPEAKTYIDARELFAAGGIDAVHIATPDHMHAPLAMLAMQRGLHVYCQKPLTHSVHEARQLADAAAKYKVITQMGNQHRSGTRMRLARHFVEQGVIGTVREVHTWTDRPIWPQGIDRPTDNAPPPTHLHWDLWLGVAPKRPFVPEAYHPFNWRGYWDFGTGSIGDMGCHIMDPAIWILGLPAPKRIEVQGPPPNDETAPKWMIARYNFPATDTQPATTITWYDGGKHPPKKSVKLPPSQTWPATALLLVGEKGQLIVSHSMGPLLLPEERFAGIERPRIEAVDHYEEWTNACMGKGRTVSPFAEAGPVTEAVLLANVAYRVGKPLEWDAPHLRATNAPEAGQYLRRDYRDGWTSEEK